MRSWNAKLGMCNRESDGLQFVRMDGVFWKGGLGRFRENP